MKEDSTIKISKAQKVCYKHADSLCVYTAKEYPSGCPFCVAQLLLNPGLEQNSPLKNEKVKNLNSEIEEEIELSDPDANMPQLDLALHSEDI